MIKVKNAYGELFILNSDLIETIESIPETKINLTTGKYMLVSDTKEEIIEKIIAYNQKIYGSDKTLTVYHKQQTEDSETDGY